MRFYDQLGGPQTYNHYPIGWAMAFNTPYKLFKRYASHEGGIADTAIISWPNGIDAHGEVRDNYVNVCDITPTVYELLGIAPPGEVGGCPQKPLDGVSFKAALDDPTADGQGHPVLHHAGHPRHLAQGLVREHRARRHARRAGSNFDSDRWELFHIESDRSQCHDLAAEQPEKLEELKKLWFAEAAKYNGLPLADLNILEMLARWRPYLVGDRKNFTYYPDTAEVGIGRRPNCAASRSRCWPRSPSTTPVPRACSTNRAPGTVGTCCSCRTAGCTTSTTSWAKRSNRFRRRGRFRRAAMCWACATSGPAPSRAATRHSAMSRCTSTRPSVATGPGSGAHPGSFGLAGGGIVGGPQHRSAGLGSSYQAPFAFTGGTIAKVVVDVSGTPYIDTARELAAAFARD